MMDRRSEPRFALDKPVTVTVLSPLGETSRSRNLPIIAKVADVSERGMRLILERPLPIDAAVRLDFEDAMVLGEVKYCVPVEGGFGAGLDLQHCLRNLAELLQVREEFVPRSR